MADDDLLACRQSWKTIKYGGRSSYIDDGYFSAITIGKAKVLISFSRLVGLNGRIYSLTALYVGYVKDFILGDAGRLVAPYI